MNCAVLVGLGEVGAATQGGVDIHLGAGEGEGGGMVFPSLNLVAVGPLGMFTSG